MTIESHTIPDEMAARVARLINEAEDMRQQAADDLKQIYADLREELRALGWTGSVVSTEVAALKGAIAEMRLDDEKKAKREEKGERVDDYVSLLTRARARGTGAKVVDRKARAALRTSEAMDDNKAFSAELVAAGLISEKAHAENIALSDAVARKYGAGVIDTETGEILKEHEASDGSPSVSSPLAAPVHEFSEAPA